MATARATYRSVTSNVYTSDPAGQQAGTIREAWGRADILKINEGGDAVVNKTLRALAGASFYNAGGAVGSNLQIAWRDSVFQKITQGSITAYVGGKGDGPSRGCVWVLLKHKATGRLVYEVNYHQIAKAWTTAPGRRDDWNQIQDGVGKEVARIMALRPGVPVVISGDVNKQDSDGPVTFPHIDERNVSTPNSYGSNRYDQFFLVGKYIKTNGSAAFTTNSDHKSVVVNVELTAPVTPPKTVTATTARPPTAAAASVPAPPPVPLPITASRAAQTYLRAPKWRVFAQRMHGDGSDGEIVHSDLPVQNDLEIEDVLTGHNGMTFSITPEFRSLLGPDGQPLLREYRTAVWAEESGNIHGGGIITSSGFDGPNWKVECTGLTGYPDEMPYTDSVAFVQVDPLDVLRHIWAHIQGQPKGNVGLIIDSLKTDKRIGTELQQVEFDTISGPVSFEAGPVKLAWYQTHDLAEELEKLATEHGFDWHEEHFWTGDTLNHFLRLGYPRLGRRREDLRFVIGENIHQIPPVDRDGADYATETLILGAGEGSAMKRGTARRDIDGLRRVAVLSDPSLSSQKAVNAVAESEMAWRVNIDEISDVVVRKHPHADITSVQVGDEIQVQGDAGWVDINTWFRVIARRIKPLSEGTMTLTIQRTDRQAS